MMPFPELDHSLNCCISSSLPAAHQWINHSLMNYIDHTSSNCNEHLRGSFDQMAEAPTQNTSLCQAMAQDLGFPGSLQNYNCHVHREAAARLSCSPEIREEISQPRLYGAIINDHDHHQPYQMMIDEKLLARALQNSSHNLLVPPTEDFNRDINISTNDCANYYFPSNMMMLPSVMNPSLPAVINALDALAASRWNVLPFVREDAAFGSSSTSTSTSTLMQQLFQGTCTNQQKVPFLRTGVAGKRGINNSILENKITSQSHRDIPTKSPSASFSPFKVRKEKLGDRIAALQQLVAPFGKTDTASVLMEAIGYIKFLQEQVETLSVPYLRLRLPTRKKQRTAQASASASASEAAPAVVDLRSRGLCLVPSSICSSPNFYYF